MGKRARAALSAAAVFGAANAVVQIDGTEEASASNFGWWSGIFFTDDSNLTIYYYDVVSKTSKAIDDVRTYSLDPTNLITTRYGSHGSGLGQADVTVMDSYYGDTGWAGRAVCQETYYQYGYTDFYDTCVHNHVQINLSSDNGTDPNYRKAVVCHELGHTVGLHHTSDTSSCLRNPAQSTVVLNDHDKAHINGRHAVGYYYWDPAPV